MNNQDLCITNGNDRFNYRVAIIIENNGRVLLEQCRDFWNMIGGRVHFGESSLDAANRELREELGIEVEGLRLVNVSENFFEWMGKRQHENLFIYKVNIGNEYDIVHKAEFKCLDKDELFKWHKVNDVDKLLCKPEIIKHLVKGGKTLSHVIHKDT